MYKMKHDSGGFLTISSIRTADLRNICHTASLEWLKLILYSQ